MELRAHTLKGRHDQHGAAETQQAFEKFFVLRWKNRSTTIVISYIIIFNGNTVGTNK